MELYYILHLAKLMSMLSGVLFAVTDYNLWGNLCYINKKSLICHNAFLSLAFFYFFAYFIISHFIARQEIMLQSNDDETTFRNRNKKPIDQEHVIDISLKYYENKEIK